MGTDSWLNLSRAFTGTRRGREPSHRRCTRTLTDSCIRALIVNFGASIVNFDATIAPIDARRGGGHRPLRRLLSPGSRPEGSSRARPHRPEGIPPSALSGRLLKRARELGVTRGARRSVALPVAGQRLFQHPRDDIAPLDARGEKLRPAPGPRTHALGRGGADRAESPDCRGGRRVGGWFLHLAPSRPQLRPGIQFPANPRR